MAYVLRVQRDRLNVVDSSNQAVAWANIDGCGMMRGIEMLPNIRKSNRSRLAVLRAMGNNDDAGVLLRARNYYASERAAGIEMGNGCPVDPSVFPIWAGSILDKYCPGWRTPDQFGHFAPDETVGMF